MKDSWNATSFSQFLVSVVFHNNPKCFFKHQQETLFHYIVLKTWFWALIRAKNETNRSCWSQNENAPKDWRSLTLNILLSCPPRIVRLIFSNSLETQLWFSANLKTQKFPIPVKTLKVLQIIWLRRYAGRDSKFGTTSRKLKTKKFRISGKRCKFLQILAWT